MLHAVFPLATWVRINDNATAKFFAVLQDQWLSFFASDRHFADSFLRTPNSSAPLFRFVVRQQAESFTSKFEIEHKENKSYKIKLISNDVSVNIFVPKAHTERLIGSAKAAEKIEIGGSEFLYKCGDVCVPWFVDQQHQTSSSFSFPMDSSGGSKISVIDSEYLSLTRVSFETPTSVEIPLQSFRERDIWLRRLHHAMTIGGTRTDGMDVEIIEAKVATTNDAQAEEISKIIEPPSESNLVSDNTTSSIEGLRVVDSVDIKHPAPGDTSQTKPESQISKEDDTAMLITTQKIDQIEDIAKNIELSDQIKPTLINAKSTDSGVRVQSLKASALTYFSSDNNSERDLQLNAWDFAGQPEFYMCHRHYLLDKAVYVITFDASNIHLPRTDEDIEISNREPKFVFGENVLDLRFWLRSLLSLKLIPSRPKEKTQNTEIAKSTTSTTKILILGTHVDEITDDRLKTKECREQYVSAALEDIAASFNNFDLSVEANYFEISASPEHFYAGVDAFRKKLLELSLDVAKSVTVHKQYDIVESVVETLQSERARLPIASFMEILNQFANMTGKVDSSTLVSVKEGLQVLKGWGRILLLTPDDGLERLKESDIVGLSPSWLQTSIKKVLRNMPSIIECGRFKANEFKHDYLKSAIGSIDISVDEFILFSEKLSICARISLSDGDEIVFPDFLPSSFIDLSRVRDIPIHLTMFHRMFSVDVLSPEVLIHILQALPKRTIDVCDLWKYGLLFRYDAYYVGIFVRCDIMRTPETKPMLSNTNGSIFLYVWYDDDVKKTAISTDQPSSTMNFENTAGYPSSTDAIFVVCEMDKVIRDALRNYPGISVVDYVSCTYSEPKCSDYIMRYDCENFAINDLEVNCSSGHVVSAKEALVNAGFDIAHFDEPLAEKFEYSTSTALSDSAKTALDNDAGAGPSRTSQRTLTRVHLGDSFTKVANTDTAHPFENERISLGQSASNSQMTQLNTWLLDASGCANNVRSPL